MENYIGFRKVRDSYGWLGNMSAHPIEYKGKIWRTCECLFQCLRFEDEDIIEMLRNKRSPMTVKMKSKKYKDRMVVEVMSGRDVDNMRLVVGLKYEQYEWIKEELRKLRGKVIYEDVSNRRGGKRKLFWGGKLEGGQFIGENVLGKIWMELINK